MHSVFSFFKYLHFNRIKSKAQRIYSFINDVVSLELLSLSQYYIVSNSTWSVFYFEYTKRTVRCDGVVKLVVRHDTFTSVGISSSPEGQIDDYEIHVVHSGWSCCSHIHIVSHSAKRFPRTQKRGPGIR